MFISGSVPLFKALVRKEFLYNLEKHHNESVECTVFGVCCVRGRGLGWNILLPNGAMFWRVPLHALKHKETAPKVLLSQVEFWDCLSSTFTVHKFDYLKELDCIVKLKSGDEIKASYMFTIDFADLDNSLPSAHADIPSEHKCAHILKLDDGNFASMPNNRIIWRDASFVTKTLEEMPADYLTNTHVFSAEQDFVSSDDDYYFYDAIKQEQPNNPSNFPQLTNDEIVKALAFKTQVPKEEIVDQIIYANEKEQKQLTWDEILNLHYVKKFVKLGRSKNNRIGYFFSNKKVSKTDNAKQAVEEIQKFINHDAFITVQNEELFNKLTIICRQYLKLSWGTSDKT